MLVLHPSNPVSASCIKSLSTPCLVVRFRACWLGIRTNSFGIGIELPVGRSKRCFGPVCLHTPALGCPVIRVPEAGIHPHGLALGKWDTRSIMVIEHPYWYVIYQETAKNIQRFSISVSWINSYHLIEQKYTRFMRVRLTWFFGYSIRWCMCGRLQSGQTIGGTAVLYFLSLVNTHWYGLCRGFRWSCPRTQNLSHHVPHLVMTTNVIQYKEMDFVRLCNLNIKKDMDFVRLCTYIECGDCACRVARY